MWVDEELMHYGIPGQKWGVRRYQNEDGSLTSEGKLRYRVGEVRERRANAEHDYNAFDSQQAKLMGRIMSINQVLGDMEIWGEVKHNSHDPKDWPESQQKKYNALEAEKKGCLATGEILQRNKEFILSDLSDQGIVGAAYQTIREGRSVAEQIIGDYFGMAYNYTFAGNKLKTYDNEEAYNEDKQKEINKSVGQERYKRFTGKSIVLPVFGDKVGDSAGNEHPTDTISGIKEQKRARKELKLYKQKEREFLRNPSLVKRVAADYAKRVFGTRGKAIKEAYGFTNWKDYYKYVIDHKEDEQLFWEYITNGLGTKNYKGALDIRKEIYGDTWKLDF